MKTTQEKQVDPSKIIQIGMGFWPENLADFMPGSPFRASIAKPESSAIVQQLVCFA